MVEKAINSVKSGQNCNLVLECRQRTGANIYRYYQMTFNCPSEVFLKGFKGVVFSEQDITERKKAGIPIL